MLAIIQMEMQKTGLAGATGSILVSAWKSNMEIPGK